MLRYTNSFPNKDTGLAMPHIERKISADEDTVRERVVFLPAHRHVLPAGLAPQEDKPKPAATHPTRRQSSRVGTIQRWYFGQDKQKSRAEWLRRLNALYDMIVEAAEKGAPCPSNAAICGMFGLKSVASPPHMLQTLQTMKKIKIVRQQTSRIVTVLATGKMTTPHSSARSGRR